MLKSNIDLTANGMFSRRSNGDNAIWRFSNVKFPLIKWQPWQQSVVLGIKEVILTGNREQIERKKQYAEMNSGDTCDCCGEYLKIIPWDRTYGLCRKCGKDMEKKFGNKKKYPWKYDTDMRVEKM